MHLTFVIHGTATPMNISRSTEKHFCYYSSIKVINVLQGIFSSMSWEKKKKKTAIATTAMTENEIQCQAYE